MGEPVEEVAESLSKVSVGGGEENVIYTSDSRGSDEAGDGTYKVPFKTVIKVREEPKNWRKKPVYGQMLQSSAKLKIYRTLQFHIDDLCRP